MIILTEEQKVNLINASIKAVHNTSAYQKADAKDKLDAILTKCVEILGNLNTYHDLIKYSNDNFSEKFFKEFNRKIKNAYVRGAAEESVKDFYKNISTEKEPSAIRTLYNMIERTGEVDNAITKESVKPFDSSKFVEDLYSFINKELKIKMPGRSFRAFYDKPSHYLSKVTYLDGAPIGDREFILKIAIIKMIIGLAFLDGRKLKTYVTTVKGFLNQDYSKPIEEASNRLHGFNIGRKMVYVQRMSELNAIILEYLMLKNDAFDTVLKNVVRSITYCKDNEIKTFLKVTNIIMNNLTVEMFSNRKFQKAKEEELNQIIAITEKENPHVVILIKGVAQYIEFYYKNRSNRLCAHDTSTAMKQALAAMCKFDPDLFTLKVVD